MQTYLYRWPFFALVAAVQAWAWPVIAAKLSHAGWVWGAVLVATALAIIPLLSPDKRMMDILKKSWFSAIVLAVWSGVALRVSPEFAGACALAGGLSVVTLRHCGVAWPTVNTWILTVFCSIWLWDSAAEGRLLAVWSLLVFALVVLLSNPRLQDWLVIVISMLLGVLAGTQGLFFWLPLVVAGGLVAVWPERAGVVATVGGVICYFTMDYLGTPWPFWPFSAPEVFWSAATLVSITLILMVYHWRWWSPVWQLAWGLGAVALVFDLANLVELADFSGYWQAAMPAVVFALLGRIGHENRIKHL